MTGTTISDDAIESLDQGIASADTARAPEFRFVEGLAKNVREAQEFDKDARKQYAVDRAYARGDSGFTVDGNMVGTFIDILKSFIYAKNPEVDILPAVSAEPPSVDALRDAAEMTVDDGMLDEQALPQAQAMIMQGIPPQAAMEQARTAIRDSMVQEQFQQLQNRYQKRQRDNKAYAETLEMVVSWLWSKAKLKIRGQKLVGSSLTIGPGWLKASWQERTQDDPAIRKQMNDVQASINRLAAMDEDDDECADRDERTEEYRLQMEELDSQVKQLVARGFVVDFVPAEYITVAPGVDIASAEDAPWIDETVPMRVADAKAKFNLTAEQCRAATKYQESKPVMRKNVSPVAVTDNDAITAKEANRFTSSDSSDTPTGDWIMVHETWSIEHGKYFTWIEGVKGYANPPAEPTPTERFYPYFNLTIGDVDGQRHPQSLVSRSHKLVDEYYRIKSAEREHRRRVKPKTLFLKGMVDSDSVTRVSGGETGELVGIDTQNPKADARSIFMPLAYPQMDPALYDTSRVMSDIERIFGVQEALSGAINTAKTATEAQIQQTGMQSRTGAMRDALEDMLTSLAFYTAEVSRAHMDLEDVQAVVGPDAMWPEYKMGEDLGSMLTVTIRAGSTGKPNTTAERQSWASLLPILQAGIQQVGQLRGSSPGDMADALAELLSITLKRNDERIDLETLLPQAGAQQLLPAMPALPAPGPAGPIPVVPDSNPMN